MNNDIESLLKFKEDIIKNKEYLIAYTLSTPKALKLKERLRLLHPQKSEEVLNEIVLALINNLG